MAYLHMTGRLIPSLALLACTLPLATPRPQMVQAATAAAVRPTQPILAVPRSLLTHRAVPVIVEMAPALSQTPSFSSDLAGLRGRIVDALQSDHARNIHLFHVIPAIAATVDGTLLPTLLRQPGVRAIVLDRQRAILPMNEDPLLAPAAVVSGTLPQIDAPTTTEPESYSLTRADLAHARGFTGAGVRVAVIDSGLDVSVPDLANAVATDANGVPLRVDFTGTDLQDTVGHGTACASMIASQGRVAYTSDTLYNSPPGQIYVGSGLASKVYRSHFHLYGMAPGVRLMSAKIFDNRVPNGSGGYDSWIVRAIEWAIDNHANVISESFGGLSLPSNGTDPIAEADEAAVAAGITVVAADGNEGPGQATISSPANAPGVIAVGASTEYRAFGQTGFLAPFGQTTGDNIASFTSRGPTTDGRTRPDLVAPGAFSWALLPMKKSDEAPDHPPYNLVDFGGTSKATPVTAGAAALVIAAFRASHNGASPTPALVRSILMSSAHDLGYPAFDQGAGRLDAWEAVQTAIHSGPSFLTGPSALTISGPVAAPFSSRFALTNTGSIVQTYTLDALRSHQAKLMEWDGTIRGAVLDTYHFTVPVGLEHLEGKVYWNSSDRFQIQESAAQAISVKEVALRVALYDPKGRFVNYSYGVASGYAVATAGHPMPGVWTLVVTQNGRKDSKGVRRFSDKEPYRATLSTFVSVPAGTLTPSSVRLAPGQSASILFQGRTSLEAGTGVATILVHGDHTAALPVGITSYVTLSGDNAFFNGVFNGASNGYFSLANENKVYSLNVVSGTRTLDVSLSWPNSGYGVLLLLLDPNGQIVDGQFNGVSNGAANAPFDLTQHTLQALWSDPAPGRWQVIVMDVVFAGQQRAEPFTGHIKLNSDAVAPLAIARSVLPGATFNLDLAIRNDNGPQVAEGYIGYATSDTTSIIPLGGIKSPFGNTRHLYGSDVYTYTTAFVPPGTREVGSSIAVIHPSVTADLSFADPIGFSRAEGQSQAVTIAGKIYPSGTAAVVDGPSLPIGPWNAQVTLRRPFNAHTTATIVGTSYARALTPLPWINFDHGLFNGRITGGQPLILFPGQSDALHATVTVPLNTQPGLYHAHLFVISVFADQVADIPLTLTVVADSGVEPASAVSTLSHHRTAGVR